MREYIDNILQEIDSEIDNFDFYSLKELRTQIADYTFSSKEEEILFSKSKTRRY